jgi:2-methylcitrate dehydratase
MTKSLRFPRTATNGILSAMLASKGFTGPTRIIEGNSGFMQVVMGGNYDLKKLTEDTGKFRIMHTGVKPFPCEGTNHGHIIATLTLVKDHDIKPEDVAHVKLKLTARTAEHCGDPVKRHPYNKETADHSAYYMTAIAIIDQAVGPDQFLPDKINDPKIHELIDKVTVEATSELEHLRDAGISEITTKQGQTYTCRVDIPKGHPLDPMTDTDIEEKFWGMASKYMGDKQMKQVIDTIYNLDNLDGISSLMKLMVFEQ